MKNKIIYTKEYFEAYFLVAGIKIKIINFLKIVVFDNFTKIYINKNKSLKLPKTRILINGKRK